MGSCCRVQLPTTGKKRIPLSAAIPPQKKTKANALAGRLNAPGLRWSNLNPRQRARLAGGVSYAVVLVFVFSSPLLTLIAHVAGSGLHSHILLVPFISAYLIYIQRNQLPKEPSVSPGMGVISFAVGLAAGVGWWSLPQALSHNDSLALMAFSFICLVWAGGFLFLGCQWMAAVAFPAAFLIFMVPLPDTAVEWLETGSKLASAEAADWYFALSGTPVLRDGVIFQLPGMVIEVAQECSGIRSSWVLFITGWVASYLFLKSPWRRTVLVALVIPLGILRNGFRIMVIGLLCVHMGPQMIHSAIHKQGGPLFFALSLIPLFVLLWWLRSGERGARGP